MVLSNNEATLGSFSGIAPREKRMIAMLRVTLLTSSFFLPTAMADSCKGEEITFSFSNIKANQAFSLVANYADLKLVMDGDINESKPIRFSCLHWRKAATHLAEEFDVNLKIYNGKMYVEP